MSFIYFTNRESPSRMIYITYCSISEVLLLKKGLTILLQIGVIIAFTWIGDYIVSLLHVPIRKYYRDDFITLRSSFTLD